jgi:iron complex transport system permease protein
MQGIFRNPLADPGLIGVSSGAALAASLYIVLGDQLVNHVGEWADIVATPICAFFGALGVTFLVWRMGSIGNRVSVPRLLLAGIAINALAGAVIGSLTLVATDSELRDLTFWSLGSLNGATWETVVTAALGIMPVMIFAPGLARSLDAWLLGEAEAGHLGVNVVRLKRVAVCTTALAVGAAVAVSGMIGFIGLVIPHLIRLTLGPGHRYLLPGSALLGALVLLASDMLARTIIMPVEVPIGIVTALGGAPFFLLLLHRSRNTGLLG